MSDTKSKVILSFGESPKSVDEERRNFVAFAKANNLVIPDNFIDGIQKGDIVEMYSYPETRQIYCNDEFMRYCSYTAEEMQTIPFPKLFWRADEAQTALLERASEVIGRAEKAQAWNLAPHELVESLHPRRRTFEVHMKTIAPIIHAQTGQRCGFASTLKVELIYEWPEAV